MDAEVREQIGGETSAEIQYNYILIFMGILR
jgi:hypothetical protein